MAKFFTTPSDLLNWVKTQNNSANEAADKISAVIGSEDHSLDIAESTKRIFAGTHAEVAAQVIFNILSRYDVTEASIKQASEKVGGIYAANELLKTKMITADQHQKMVKEAQIMRQPGQYQMELRVCPKLPMSVGSRRISTYNCLHYCNASLVLDDEPQRVYCLEALWRKHVMDKFNRDIRDPKTGQLVGGYIGNRFYTFPDAGTPANPDVPRDGGHPMNLVPGERSRQPRPQEWSTERRLQEQREKGSTKSITLGASDQAIKTAGFHEALLKQASATGFIKISSETSYNPPHSEMATIFSEAIDLHTSGIAPADAAVQLAQSHQMRVEDIIRIQESAIKKLAQHQADVYSMVKTADMLPSVAEPSALEQQENGGEFTVGDEPIQIGGNQIPPGTVLIRDTRNPSVFYTPDKTPVHLTPDQVNSSLINRLDTDTLGLTKKTDPLRPTMPNQINPAQPPAEQASTPTAATPASVPTANPNAAPVY